MRFLVAFVFLSTFTSAADALRVGAARADITPETTVLNWVTGKPYGAVLDPIFVHALVLDDGAKRVALIRWDLVDVSESARDEVRAAVGAALRTDGRNIMVHASHTHSAPFAPIWRAGHRGLERDLWWALRYMPPQNEFPPFQRWMARLLAATVDAARRAAEGAQPASLAIGRVAVPEFLYNRRPRAPAWGLAEAKPAVAPGHSHPDWNAEVLHGGATFGPMDRTLSIVTVRGAADQPIASLFHVACHSVSIYPSNPAISADWPGAASRTIAASLGGEALFLQGTCGDITPWRRGEAAVATMAEAFAAKARTAVRQAVKLTTAPLEVASMTIQLPLTPVAKKRLGADTVAAEIQAIVCGPLAFVALPGEPMTELGQEIRARSPFPQTLVLGYANGNGAHYVGMPGEKARGGYEAGDAGAGTDECGTLMVDAAARVLRDLFERTAPARAAAAKAARPAR